MRAISIGLTAFALCASLAAVAEAAAFVHGPSGSPDGVVVMLSNQAGLCTSAKAGKALHGSTLFTAFVYPVGGSVFGTHAIGSGGDGSGSSPYGVDAALIEMDASCQWDNLPGGRAQTGSIHFDAIGAGRVAGSFSLTMARSIPTAAATPSLEPSTHRSARSTPMSSRIFSTTTARSPAASSG